MIEHASLIAVIIAVLALMGLIYVAFFMPGRDQDQPRDLKRDIDRNEMHRHYSRWEDRL
jgi:hypothetical protein